MTVWSVCIVGAGQIGTAIAALLAGSPDYRVVLADSDTRRLAAAKARGFRVRRLDATQGDQLAAALSGADAVVSAAPFTLTPAIAGAARQIGAHYFDLTEDVAATRVVRALADGAPTAFMPQCGLAPGFVGIAGASLLEAFDQVDTLALRVGALPRFPTNALKYNLTWSTEGLINEYCNPCDVIADGVPAQAAPLENLENVRVDGVDYECFNTSGGLGTLAETLSGKARHVSYRTIRYPGHRDIVKLLLHDLHLRDRRDLLHDVLETALPRTDQDVVLIFCTATGRKDGQMCERALVNKSFGRHIAGRRWSAIQIATASGVAGVMDLMRCGTLPQAGFVRQEQVALPDFMATAFGRCFSDGALTAADMAV